MVVGPYSDTYWYPDGTLAANVQALVFLRDAPPTLAVLYTDATETTTLPNPTTTDGNGLLELWAAPGDYWFRVGGENFPVSIDTDAVVRDVWPDQYEHVQAVASATWSITHNLGVEQPDVSIYIGGVLTPSGQVTYVDTDTLSITFGAPIAGTATLRR